MKLFVLLTIVAAASVQAAQNVTYNVISDHPQSKLEVVVDNITYPLKRSEKCPILFIGSAPAAQNGYSYAKITDVDRTIEPFVRAPCWNSSTVNEFYNRNWNSKVVANFPNVMPPISAIHRFKTELHHDGQIPTIYLQGNQTEFDSIHKNTSSDAKVSAKMTYISLDSVQVFEHVDVDLSGRSSRWLSKLSYNLKIHKDLLYGFKRLKLRSLGTDPSFVREHLVVDFIKSAGVPTSDFSYVRLMLNDAPLGLFGLIEHFKDPWLANEFGDGSSHYKHGELYQGDAMSVKSLEKNRTSDLGYNGDDATAYADGEYVIKEKPTSGKGSFDRLRDFTKFINTAPSTEHNAASIWQTHLDTDSFIRMQALEILLGFSDGYLSMTDNYYLFNDVQSNRFIYVPSDFDLTLGSTFLSLQNMQSGNYSDYPGFTLRPLTSKLMSVPVFKQQLENTLKDYTLNLMNPKVTDKRIDDLVNLISDDVEWDIRCPRVSTTNFTIEKGPDAGLTNLMDADATADFNSRMANSQTSFHDAVYGPLSRPSLLSVKEWIKNQSEAILKTMEN